MQREKGIPNENGFHLRQKWNNGAYTDCDFDSGQALFRKDGTLLSFDLEYTSDRYVASIALVPKDKWVQFGLDFLHDWLAPIGLKVVTKEIQFTSDRQGRPTNYESLVKFGVGHAGKAALHFLTKDVRDNNLAYVNIYTEVLYKTGPIKISPNVIFNKKGWF